MFFIFTILKSVEGLPENQTFICDRNLFGEVELLGYELCAGPGDVISIERSIVKEIVNDRTNDSQDMYIATLTSEYKDDNGKPKKYHYQVLCYAVSLDDATEIFLQYMLLGLDEFTLTALKKTKIKDYIE